MRATLAVAFVLAGCLCAAEPVVRPPVAPPADAGEVEFDIHGNHWCLVPGKGVVRLHVLPAQSQGAWQRDELSGPPPGKWRWLVTDWWGLLWISDGQRVLGMNPHKPEEGWFDVSADPAFPKGDVTSLTLAPSGSAKVAFEEGDAVEVDRHKGKTRIGPVSEGTWQKRWELVAYLPGGSHDLGGDVLDGKFYMDWAITGDYGYPSTGRFHSKLLSFDPTTMAWSVVADYGLPRGYCGVGALDGKIWTVAGAALNKEGKRHNPVLTQIYDPAGDTMTRGPDLPSAIPACVALGSGGRLYVLGYGEGKDEAPLKLYSIGKGEMSWTVEPEGPVGNGSSYGTELDGKLYTVVAHRCVAIYDTKTKTWETTEAPHSPRSPAVSHYRGEIWIMGGRTKEGEGVSYVYNPDSGQWREGPDLPRRLAWACGFNIDGRMYLAGGCAYRGFSNATFRLR
jgi:hypothetical protein